MENKYCFPCETECDKDAFECKIEAIYNRLADETSREIFVDRLLYSMCRDYRYIRKMLMVTGNGDALDSFLSSQSTILVYGAGINGTRLVNIFPEKNWAGYIDKNKQGEYNGLPVYSIEQGKDVKGAVVIISNLLMTDRIKQELVSSGYDEQAIFILNDFDKEYEKEIYFDRECVTCLEDFDACFVDVGCYNGEDTKRYLDWCGRDDAPVMAFEADPNNFQVCMKLLEGCTNVKLFGFGLSDREEVKRFKQTTSPSSKFSDEGDVEVQTKTLDGVMRGQKVGFIKMDVEGYEEKCLLGAREIISNQHPILAISIYHKREDMWKLPALLLQMNPDYQFYLRHYTTGVTDTVLYAVQEGQNE